MSNRTPPHRPRPSFSYSSSIQNPGKTARTTTRNEYDDDNKNSIPFPHRPRPSSSSSYSSPLRFSDLAEVNPRTPVKLPDTAEVSFIPMTAVDETGHWVDRQARRLGEVKKGYTVFQEGDILFAKITPCAENGKGCHATNLVNGIGFGSTEFHVLRAKSGVSPRIVFHLAHDPFVRAKAVAVMGGSAGQQRVPADFFDLFYLPPDILTNQNHKAALLDAVDDAIDATRAVIAQTRRLKSALLDDLLSNGLPGERKHRREVKGVGEIPSDWQVFCLDDMSDGRRPPLRTGPFGSSLKTEHFVPSGRPVLTIGSLGEGEIVASELLFVDEAKATELREYEVLPGDVVFSRVADVGRSVTIPEHAAGWIISSNLMRITLDKRKFDPWFLRQSLVHNRLVTDQVRRLTADGGRQIVTSETLSGLLFPMPLRKEQDAIAEVIRRVDQRLRQDREIEVQLSQAKSALSQALLTGQIGVSVQEGKL